MKSKTSLIIILFTFLSFCGNAQTSFNAPIFVKKMIFEAKSRFKAETGVFISNGEHEVRIFQAKSKIPFAKTTVILVPGKDSIALFDIQFTPELIKTKPIEIAKMVNGLKTEILRLQKAHYLGNLESGELKKDYNLLIYTKKSFSPMFVLTNDTEGIKIRFTNDIGVLQFDKLYLPELTLADYNFPERGELDLATYKSIYPDKNNEGSIIHKRTNNFDAVQITDAKGILDDVDLTKIPIAKEEFIRAGYTEDDFNKIALKARIAAYPKIFSVSFDMRTDPITVKALQSYKVVNVLAFYNGYQTYYILWVPFSDNQDLHPNFRPTDKDGFYMVSFSSAFKVFFPKVIAQVQPANNNNNTSSNTVGKTTTSGNVSTSSYSLDIFKEKGSMVLIKGYTMYVFKIIGKSNVDNGTIAARCAVMGKITGAYKYEMKNGWSCNTVKNTYSSKFTVNCIGDLDLDK